MLKIVQTCHQCGAGLTIDDMRGDTCPYCRAVYPHRAEATQYAEALDQAHAKMLRRFGCVRTAAIAGVATVVGGVLLVVAAFKLGIIQLNVPW